MKRNNERKVFVFNGYGDTGGAFLLYNVGRICHENFGSPVYIVYERKTKRKQGGWHPRFHYKMAFPSISLDEMKQIADAEDVFLCNPAHSTKWFGATLAMKKVMYMQGINTYPVLDIFFDHYVSVSRFVRDHVENVFNVQSQVISPFINHEVFQNKIPWQERSSDILILNYKGYAAIHFGQLLKKFKATHPSELPKFKLIDEPLTQKALAERYNHQKYFLTLNPIEGFGLPPLEAMACGCAVIGFDSMGGRDYFESGRNSLIVPYGDFESLIDVLRFIHHHPDMGKDLAKRAGTTAKRFSYKNFESEWVDYLKRHVYSSQKS